MILLCLNDFFFFNFDELQTLSPKDVSATSPFNKDRARKHFEVNVEFVGYSGCFNGSMDVNRDGAPDTAPEVTDSVRGLPPTSSPTATLTRHSRERLS